MRVDYEGSQGRGGGAADEANTNHRKQGVYRLQETANQRLMGGSCPRERFNFLPEYRYMKERITLWLWPITAFSGVS
ncbi:hypothetical protein ASF09_17690 [Sphingomonas sp. Leaf242]|nr:hypothetical protein ASF09_17690 [Sphingomonas sp. Leaf242]